jgi:hypothetical protein
MVTCTTWLLSLSTPAAPLPWGLADNSVFYFHIERRKGIEVCIVGNLWTFCVFPQHQHLLLVRSQGCVCCDCLFVHWLCLYPNRMRMTIMFCWTHSECAQYIWPYLPLVQFCAKASSTNDTQYCTDVNLRMVDSQNLHPMKILNS